MTTWPMTPQEEIKWLYRMLSEVTEICDKTGAAVPNRSEISEGLGRYYGVDPTTFRWRDRYGYV